MYYSLCPQAAAAAALARPPPPPTPPRRTQAAVLLNQGASRVKALATPHPVPGACARRRGARRYKRLSARLRPLSAPFAFFTAGWPASSPPPAADASSCALTAFAPPAAVSGIGLQAGAPSVRARAGYVHLQKIP